MNKILSGSAVNYGSTLPPLSKTTDGAMFYLVDTYTDPAGSPSNNTKAAIIRGAGLYTYVFAKDSNVSTLGNQAGYMWVTVANMENFVKKLGDEMTGVLLMSGQNWAGSLNIKNKTPAVRLTNTANIADHQELRMTYGTVSGTNAGVFKIERRKNDDGTGLASSMVWLGDFLSIDTLGVIKSFGNTVWHSGSDGTGSGLDADKLDGQEGTYYLSTANHTGTVPVSRGGTGSTSVNSGGVLFGSTGTTISSTATGLAGQVLVSDGANAPVWKNTSSVASGTAGSLATPRKITLTGGVTGEVTFDGSKDVQVPTTVADFPWTSLRTIQDFGNTIKIVAGSPYANIELSARPSYFYTYSLVNGGATAVADLKPTHFPVKSISAFDAYNSDNQAPGGPGRNIKQFKVGLTVRGEDGAGGRSMQLAAHWDYSEDSPYGGMFYRVNDDVAGTAEWGQWSQIVDATYLKRYDQEIISSKAIVSSKFTAISTNDTFGYATLVSEANLKGYAGYVEFRAKYPDTTNNDIRLGYIGNGHYDPDPTKKIQEDQGRIRYVAGEHYFSGRADFGGNVTGQTFTARQEGQYIDAAGNWDMYGSARVSYGTQDQSGGIQFFASYTSPAIKQVQVGYIGFGGITKGLTSPVPAALNGIVDYVAGDHHMYGNFYVHQTKALGWADYKLKITGVTGDISTEGRLDVGTATRPTGAKVTGNTEIVGNLTVSGTITGAISMSGIRVDAANMNANSVTTTAIADDAVTKPKIADEAVGSAQIGVNDLGNMCWNGKGDSLEGWAATIPGSIVASPSRIVALVKPPSGVSVPSEGTNTISTTVTTLAPAAKSFIFKARDSYFGPMFNVRAGERYSCQMDTYASAASIYRFAIGLECWDSSGNKPGNEGWIIGASRAVGTTGTTTISGFVTIPDWAARARIWIQIEGPGGVVYADAGQVHYATNIIVRHASYANGTINPRSLMSIGDTTNMFTDYDFVENYWSKTSTSKVDDITYTMQTDITAPAIPDAFITPRVFRFSGDTYRTRPDVGTVLGTTFASSVTQPTSALSRVYAGDELSLSYTCHSDGIATGNIVVLLQWYNAQKVALNVNSPNVTANLPLTSPTRTSGSFTVPPNACYAGVYIGRRTTANGATTQGWVNIGDIRVIQKLDASMVSDVVQTSGNLIPFSETSGGVPAIGNGWSYSKFNATDSNFSNTAYGGNTTDYPGVDNGFWHPAGTDPFLICANAYGSDLAGSYSEFRSSPFAVLSNSRYEASVYVQSHRCAVHFYIQFYSASNTPLWAPQSILSREAYSIEPKSLSTWTRLSIFAVAPANAAYAKILMRKYGTQPGYLDQLGQPDPSSFAWFLFPYMGLANATQTQPSAYSPGPTLMPSGGNISSWNKITTANAASVIAAGAIGSNEIVNDLTLTSLGITGQAGIFGTMASNDTWGIRTGGSSDSGFLEIYTGDNGSEPIYVTQLSGSSEAHKATLLDGAGNTIFPNTVTVGALVSTGNVGASSLSISGTATVGALISKGDVTAFSTSDRSIKSNIEVIPNALDKIGAIHGVTFNRTDKKDEPREAGVIAQEIQAVLPEVVRAQDTGLLGVDYGKLVSLLIQGIKEQQIQIELLKADIQELKSAR